MSEIPSGAREPYTLNFCTDYSCSPKCIYNNRGPSLRSGFQESFRKLVMNDTGIASRVPPKQIEQAFSIERQLRNVGKIFKRVFRE